MHDIHTHLYWHTYDADRDAVIQRAREAGIEKMFVIGCTVEESRQAIELTGQYEQLYAAVGIHPQEFATEEFVTNLEASIQALKTLASNKKVVAIGECGLEYYSHDSTKSITDEQKEWQKMGFLAQIKLAEELGLPLIVHCRANAGASDAYEDMSTLLSQIKTIPIVLHCYMGDTEVTKQLLALDNVYFSFTGNITYPVKKTWVGTKDDLTETVKLIPLDRLFTETDCPFLSPQSKRGERNEPANVVEVAKQVAFLRGKTPEEVEKALKENFRTVFTEA
jgi:TatD DNase family protein